MRESRWTLLDYRDDMLMKRVIRKQDDFGATKVKVIGRRSQMSRKLESPNQRRNQTNGDCIGFSLRSRWESWS